LQSRHSTAWGTSPVSSFLSNIRTECYAVSLKYNFSCISHNVMYNIFSITQLKYFKNFHIISSLTYELFSMFHNFQKYLLLPIIFGYGLLT
jgi:hypothetical protein